MVQRIAAAQWRVLFVVVALSVTIPFILWFAGMFWLAAIHRNPLGADLWTWLDGWGKVRAGIYPQTEQDRFNPCPLIAVGQLCLVALTIGGFIYRARIGRSKRKESYAPLIYPACTNMVRLCQRSASCLVSGQYR